MFKTISATSSFVPSDTRTKRVLSLKSSAVSRLPFIAKSAPDKGSIPMIPSKREELIEKESVSPSGSEATNMPSTVPFSGF